jgi:Tfp pilus assembly protein PilF
LTVLLAALAALAVVAAIVLALALGRTAAALARARAARRRAREVNDDVVQALVLAVYALDRGDVDRARGLIDGALEHARRMISDLIGGETVEPGDLRRETPAGVDR